MTNYDFIKVYQKTMQLGSKQYPQIDWDHLYYHFEIINSNREGMTKEQIHLARAKLELCFIKATSDDDG